MKISIKLYTAEHCTQGLIEGQLLIIGEAPCIIPVENHMPKSPDYETCLEFDGPPHSTGRIRRTSPGRR